MLKRSLMSPLGPIILFASRGELHGAYFEDADDLPAAVASPAQAGATFDGNGDGEGARNANAFAETDVDADVRLLDRAEEEFAAYFAGTLTGFSLPLATRGTAFQQAIWSTLAAVPFGTTLSYGDLAGQAGRPRALRAVGTSVGRNPWIIVVPCHRVLAARRVLGGFSSGLERKRMLLRHEGIAWRE